MNLRNKSLLSAVALGLVFSTGAIAQEMSKQAFETARDRIDAQYKTANERCGTLSGNKKDICQQESKGEEKVASAQLQAKYKPSHDADHAVRVAQAESDYAIAKERCDDLSGNAKDICVEKARAIETGALADAKTRKASDDAAKARQAPERTRSAADVKLDNARTDATIEKQEAAYRVAREKCDDFSGNTKTECLEKSKAQYEKR